MIERNFRNAELLFSISTHFNASLIDACMHLSQLPAATWHVDFVIKLASLSPLPRYACQLLSGDQLRSFAQNWHSNDRVERLRLAPICLGVHNAHCTVAHVHTYTRTHVHTAQLHTVTHALEPSYRLGICHNRAAPVDPLHETHRHTNKQNKHGCF